jgi:hypothetical protein
MVPYVRNQGTPQGKRHTGATIPDSYNPETDTGCDFPDCLRCGYLNAKNQDRCLNIRAIYERGKAEFIGNMSKSEEEEKKQKCTRAERVQLVIDNKEYLFKTIETI